MWVREVVTGQGEVVTGVMVSDGIKVVVINCYCIFFLSALFNGNARM